MVPVAVGVDFGTTNSVVAIADRSGQVQVRRFDTQVGVVEAYRSALLFSRFLLCRFGGFGRAVLEAEAVVSGFEDMAAVGETVEQRRRHFRIPDQHTMPPLLMVWSLKCALFLAAMGCLARCCPSSA